MRNTITAVLAILLLMATVSRTAHAGSTDASGAPTPNNQLTAPYLLSGAPSFDLTLVKFRESYNQDNPTLPINEFRAINSKDEGSNLTRAASKINENLYASTALEKGTGKIKTLQITYLPIKGDEEKVARIIAVAYMAALMRQFDATLSLQQSLDNVLKLLNKGKGSRFYTQSVGAIRYVVADNGEKGLTFAVEPIKLSLSEP
ncbi:DUF1454 family protein [Yersinia ruckeri]|nr:DUF1454 family protein [Yersinia ruckeri]